MNSSHHEFTKEAVFRYGFAAKVRFLIGVGALILILGAMVGSYFLFLRQLDIGLIRGFEAFVGHVKDNIAAGSALGIFYTAAFGGLFFVTLPMDILFVAFLLRGTSPFIAVPLYLAGFALSYGINYLIGLRLDTFSKKVIGPTQFYKIKGAINRRGAWAILVFNMLPLPSQPLSAILGVFRYNVTRFYVFFILGQFIKYAAISALVLAFASAVPPWLASFLGM